MKLARVEFESKTAEKAETSKSVEEGSISKMARTKQTPRKRAGEFKCHVCGEVFTQSRNRKRHLAKHGVNEKGEKLTPKEIERQLGYNKHKSKKDKSKSTQPETEGPSTSKKPKSVEFMSSSDSDSNDSSEHEDVSDESDSESEVETPLVGSGSIASTSIVPVASTSPSHTLTAAEVSAAAKLAVEKIGLGATPSAQEAVERALGLYVTESEKEDAEEGEIRSDVEVEDIRVSKVKSSTLRKTPSPDPCVRKATKPTPVFTPKPRAATSQAAPKSVPKPKSTTSVEPQPGTSKGKAIAKKPVSKISKLKQQLAPFAVGAPSVEQAQHAIRRTKSVSTHRLVREAVKDRAATDIADQFRSEFSLKAEERRQIIREVRIVRMAQRSMAQCIRRLRWDTEAGGRREFIEMLDRYLSDVEERSSESDEPSSK